MKLLLAVALLTTTLFCEAQTTKDFLAANIDPTIKPSADFFQYANGGWIKKTPIPGSESGWGIGNLVQEEIYNRILAINKKSAATQNETGSTSQKIGDFWKAAMDTLAINKAGLSVLKNEFAAIDKIKSLAEFPKAIASLHYAGVSGFFGTGVSQDDKNSDAMIFRLWQGGLGLPNREYYFKTDQRTKNIREAYKQYIMKTLMQLGFAPSAANVAMQQIYTAEEKLATASRTLEALRDPYENYNKMTLDQVSKITPSFNWKEYAHNIGFQKTLINDSVVVGQPEFFTTFGKVLKSTPLQVWKNYMKVNLIRANAPYLDNTTYMHNFNFRKLFSGATAPRPRWKRVLDAEEGAMGELLGQLFAKEYFNETAKKRYSDLVIAISEAYKERIAKLDWMSATTKQKAYEKLATVTPKVGYPEVWKDFTNLEITNASYLKNMVRSNIFWHNREMNKLGKPVNRTEWEMTPQTYNAYYNPSNNEIVLPAGIFAVPGVKDADLDDAFVYGYAGASTIGHEITHGFDDQGRQYDAKGNLTDWWTKEDGEEYIKRAKSIIQQYNEFNPVDTFHVNGDATQGENIADLGGVLLGLDAFKKTTQFKEGKLIAGLTPTQRYFLGYAYGWMYQTKKESLANQILTDVHAPAKERVNGPMVNIPEFYETFAVKQGDKMYREPSKRVFIW